jgi:hypothetical protein
MWFKGVGKGGNPDTTIKMESIIKDRKELEEIHCFVAKSLMF